MEVMDLTDTSDAESEPVIETVKLSSSSFRSCTAMLSSSLPISLLSSSEEVEHSSTEFSS